MRAYVRIYVLAGWLAGGWLAGWIQTHSSQHAWPAPAFPDHPSALHAARFFAARYALSLPPSPPTPETNHHHRCHDPAFPPLPGHQVKRGKLPSPSCLPRGCTRTDGRGGRTLGVRLLQSTLVAGYAGSLPTAYGLAVRCSIRKQDNSTTFRIPNSTRAATAVNAGTSLAIPSTRPYTTCFADAEPGAKRQRTDANP